MAPSIRVALLLASLPGALASHGAVASERGENRSLYEVVVQTTMPHLEENLRYTKTTSTQCRAKSELLVAFPVLTENAFHDCKLTKQAHSNTHAIYRLVCPASTGTTGTAAWRFNSSHLAGTLEVKLGGKNMTFHQRITAKRIGKCA